MLETSLRIQGDIAGVVLFKYISKKQREGSGGWLEVLRVAQEHTAASSRATARLKGILLLKIKHIHKKQRDGFEILTLDWELFF